METLQTLHAKIEKKANSIDRVKADLKTSTVDAVTEHLKHFLNKLKSDKQNLQSQFNEMYEKHN